MIDPDSGELHGDAPEAAEGLIVRVRVTDSSAGRDSTAEATYELEVAPFTDGQRVACYQADELACLRGVKVCSQGQWSPCGQLVFSDQTKQGRKGTAE